MGRAKLAAAGLTLLVILLLGIGARCASVASASCSLDTFFGRQPKLDVPYAGTRPEVVDLMLDMADVQPQDHVIDLGTGDGRILLAAAKDHGAGGLGVDIDPVLVKRAEAQAKRLGLEEQVSFRTEDLFQTPLSDATVVTMFLLPEVNLKLRPRLLSELRPGSRVVSHAFDMGEWTPDETGRAGGARVYLWIIPAPVEGLWTLRTAEGLEARLQFQQEFQQLRGTISQGGTSTALEQAELRGDRIRFVADLGDGKRLHQGIVRGTVIEAAAQPEAQGRATPAWQAVHSSTDAEEWSG